MRNIVLTGFMGSGKSSVGRTLGKKLGRTVVDTDELIEEKIGMKISDIFSKFGEERFREIEAEVVENVSAFDNHIIITGGGVVLNSSNIAYLRKTGVIVFLKTSPEIIYERVKNEGHRPLLDVPEPLARIKELLEVRNTYYNDNDIEIVTDSMSVDDVAKEVITKI